jgi:hypothetical protein
MYSDDRNWRSYQLGSPIRTSPDHRLLASPRGFSQLATSFFAYLRQGIHTHALSSLTIKLTPISQSSFYIVHVFASAPLPAVSAFAYSPADSNLLLCAAPLRSPDITRTPFLTAQCPSDIQLSKILLLQHFRSQKTVARFSF